MVLTRHTLPLQSTSATRKSKAPLPSGYACEIMQDFEWPQRKIIGWVEFLVGLLQTILQKINHGSDQDMVMYALLKQLLPNYMY